jgi:hypothetical protein
MVRSRRREAAVRGDQKAFGKLDAGVFKVEPFEAITVAEKPLASSFLRVGRAVNNWAQWVSWESIYLSTVSKTAHRSMVVITVTDFSPKKPHSQ